MVQSYIDDYAEALGGSFGRSKPNTKFLGNLLSSLVPSNGVTKKRQRVAEEEEDTVDGPPIKVSKFVSPEPSTRVVRGRGSVMAYKSTSSQISDTNDVLPLEEIDDKERSMLRSWSASRDTSQLSRDRKIDRKEKTKRSDKKEKHKRSNRKHSRKYSSTSEED